MFTSKPVERARHVNSSRLACVTGVSVSSETVPKTDVYCKDQAFVVWTGAKCWNVTEPTVPGLQDTRPTHPSHFRVTAETV